MKFVIGVIAIAGGMPLLTAWSFQYLGAQEAGWTVSLVLMLSVLNACMAWAIRSYGAAQPCVTKTNHDGYLSFFL